MKTKKVGGLTFAENVDTDDLDLESTLDPKIAAELQKPGKIRITTMLDEDIFDELKKLAKEQGNGKYQTLLNALLRKAVFAHQTFEQGEIDQMKQRMAAYVDERLAALEKRIMDEAKVVNGKIVFKPRKKA